MSSSFDNDIKALVDRNYNWSDIAYVYNLKQQDMEQLGIVCEPIPNTLLNLEYKDTAAILFKCYAYKLRGFSPSVIGQKLNIPTSFVKEGIKLVSEPVTLEENRIRGVRLTYRIITLLFDYGFDSDIIHTLIDNALVINTMPYYLHLFLSYLQAVRSGLSISYLNDVFNPGNVTTLVSAVSDNNILVSYSDAEKYMKDYSLMCSLVQKKGTKNKNSFSGSLYLSDYYKNMYKELLNNYTDYCTATEYFFLTGSSVPNSVYVGTRKKHYIASPELINELRGMLERGYSICETAMHRAKVLDGYETLVDYLNAFSNYDAFRADFSAHTSAVSGLARRLNSHNMAVNYISRYRKLYDYFTSSTLADAVVSNIVDIQSKVNYDIVISTVYQLYTYWFDYVDCVLLKSRIVDALLKQGYSTPKIDKIMRIKGVTCHLYCVDNFELSDACKNVGVMALNGVSAMDVAKKAGIAKSTAANYVTLFNGRVCHECYISDDMTAVQKKYGLSATDLDYLQNKKGVSL